MVQPTADYFPRAVSLYVPNCEYAIDADLDNKVHTVDFGAPLALSANGLLAAGQMVNGAAFSVTDITTAAGGAGTATSIGYYGMVPYDSLTVFNGWGRNITAVASAANTRTLTVTGYDYLGQKMQEALAMNGNTTVQGLKAFAWVTSLGLSSDTDTTTVNVGWGNKLGLPFAGETMLTEIKNQAAAANAGTFTGALIDATTPTATNADTRGTYLPVTVIPNAVVTFKIMYTKRGGNLHGNAQYTA
jgi:hypothetical protein